LISFFPEKKLLTPLSQFLIPLYTSQAKITPVNTCPERREQVLKVETTDPMQAPSSVIYEVVPVL
jgi:hypothetical protein